MRDLVLETLPLALSVLRFSPDTKLNADFVNASGFLNIARTKEELSVVCESSRLPTEQPQKIQTGWKAFKVKGPLDFSLTGILAAIAKPLAENKIPIFAISTFDTDYVLVENEHFANARGVLEQHFTIV
jgi:hypothetical protein